MTSNNKINSVSHKRLTYFLLLLSVLIPLIYVWLYLGDRATPWWSDTGEWLKYANAIQADLATRLGIHNQNNSAMLYPMWDQGVWQYPPLFFLLLIPFKISLGPILALKLLGSILYSLQPIPMYFLAKKITRNELAGIAAAFASLTPLYSEMLGWGGYPNLLGLILLGFAFHTILNTKDKWSKRNISLLAILSILIPLEHHLTFGIYIGVTLMWILLLLIKRTNLKTSLKPITFSLVLSTTTFILYRLILAYPSQYILFNEAAYYSLRLDLLVTIPWLFKSAIPVTFTLLTLLLIFTRARKNVDYLHSSMLLSWTLFPLIATFGFLLNIAIDYNRIAFFMIQPVAVIITLPLMAINPNKNTKSSSNDTFSGISEILKKAFSKDSRTLSKVFVVTIVFLTAISIAVTGLETVSNVASWVPTKDPYGDQEKLAALNWITQNTRSGSIFVADELMGRWIEGYTMRRVFMYMEPKFMYIEGQLDRYYIATSILEANYEIRNGYVRVQDQNPYSPSFCPIVSIWAEGEYKEVLAVNDTGLTDKNIVSDDVASTLKVKGDTATIQTSYNNDKIAINKTIEVNTGSKLTIKYFLEDSNLKDATVDIEMSQKRDVNLIEITAGQVKINTDIGNILIHTNTATILNSQDDHKLMLPYDLTQNGTIAIEIEAEKPAKNSLNALVATSAGQVINVNKISYIVIPRTPGSQIETRPEYQYLLKAYKTAYTNNKVIILETNES